MANRRRVTIECPITTRSDGTPCTLAEIARNRRYLNRCIIDCLTRGETPFTLKTEGEPELAAVYVDHGISLGMAERLAYYDETPIAIEHRWIGTEPEIGPEMAERLAYIEGSDWPCTSKQ